MAKSSLRVAIVCDWLTGVGGAERVVLGLHHLYPEAPIYTSQYDPQNIDWFKDADVRTLWLQKLPNGLKKFLPVLRGWAFSDLDLSEYDLVISSAGAEAKFVNTMGAIHISYVHAPTHYYWSRNEYYVKYPGFGRFDWLARVGLKLLVEPLRKKDLKFAQKPNFIVANSRHTKTEIKKYYGRDSVIIHPPVDTKRFKTQGTKSKARKVFVIVGRQVPYKRIDLAVRACSELDLPLTVIGNGPEHRKLKTMAGPSVIFMPSATNEGLSEVVRTSVAFIFPGIDDFGIAPVEALAAGTPVIAYKAGGALDYVVPGNTGEFFEEQTVESLKAVLKNFDNSKYNSTKIQKFADKFSEEMFRKKFSEFVAAHRQK